MLGKTGENIDCILHVITSIPYNFLLSSILGIYPLLPQYSIVTPFYSTQSRESNNITVIVVKLVS